MSVTSGGCASERADERAGGSAAQHSSTTLKQAVDQHARDKAFA